MIASRELGVNGGVVDLVNRQEYTVGPRVDRVGLERRVPCLDTSKEKGIVL